MRHSECNLRHTKVQHHHHHHLFAQINCTRRRTHDQHENKSRTRKAQKTGAYILPIKKTKKNKHSRNYKREELLLQSHTNFT